MIEAKKGDLRYSAGNPRRRPGIGGLAYSTLSGRALLSIAEALFEFEDHVKDKRVRSLHIDLEPKSVRPADVPILAMSIKRLIEYVLLVEVDVTIAFGADKSGSLEFEQTNLQADACCLFSGGVDSLTGILRAARTTKSVIGIFCGHTHQSHIMHIVRNIHSKYLEKESIAYAEIAAPTMSPTGYSQLRGAFYMLSGAALACQSRSRELIVAECGPTMYQPRFGGFDRVTMTTHPFVVDRCREIARLFVGRSFKIALPFEDNTKAEVAALCPRKALLRKTHSCISQRFGTHDGTCYGCVIRRLALLVSGVKDVQYERNPICDGKSNAANLLALLDFSANLLAKPRRVPGHQTQLIDEFGKQDLFKRFAMDNLAALRVVEMEGRRMTARVSGLYEYGVAAVGGRSHLDSRIAALRRIAA